MNQTRRNILSGTVSSAMLSVALAAGLLQPRSATASVLRVKLNSALRAFQPSASSPTEEIQLHAPATAVDGASFFIRFASKLPAIDTMLVFVDKNPLPFVAAFQISPDVQPDLEMRIKLAQTTQVIVVARSAGKFYHTAKTVKVTIGGCGAGVN